MQGFGKLRQLDDGDLLVTDIIIPPQEVTSGNVQTSGEYFHGLMVAMAALEPPQFIVDWPLWWHSHGRMGTFASGEDTSTLDAFATEFGGVAIGLVTNAKEEFYAWYSAEVKTPWGGKPFHESTKLGVFLEHDESPTIKRAVAGMMEQVKVKEVPAPTQHPLALKHGVMRVSQNGSTPASVWHNGVRGKWIGGVFVPDDPDAPMLTKRQRKAQRRQEAMREVLDEERLWQTGWFQWLYDQYPADHAVKQMGMTEFIKWVGEADPDDLPVTTLDALHGATDAEVSGST